jgi:hypothetical protein
MSCAVLTPEVTRNDKQGMPFMLADRQVWNLAVPTIRLRPKVVMEPDERPGFPPTETIEIESRWDYPPRVREKVQELIEAVQSDKEEIAFATILNAAVPLVKLCHEITTEEALSLFEMTPEEMEDLAIGMLRMFRGERPKPSEDPETTTES